MNFRTFTVGLLVGGAALCGTNYYNNKNKADATNIPQELRTEFERIKTALKIK